MTAAFVMLSGTMFTGESMQIYGDDNRSFESCRLDLETQAMTTSSENLVSWQADVHTRRHGGGRAQIIHNPPESA